jgi:hypothetical protein
MKRRRTIAMVASTAGLVALSACAAYAASDSDLAIFGKAPGKDKIFACFTRQYDAAHLASHPKQNVTTMALLINSYIQDDGTRLYELEIGVQFRKQSKLLQLSGACDPSTEGKTALSCGVDCDGGHIDVRVKDAQSMLVSIPDGARTWDPSSSEEPPPNKATFGTDDKLFRLDRASLKDCMPEALDDDTKAAMSAAQ